MTCILLIIISVNPLYRKCGGGLCVILVDMRLCRCTCSLPLFVASIIVVALRIFFVVMTGKTVRYPAWIAFSQVSSAGLNSEAWIKAICSAKQDVSNTTLSECLFVFGILFFSNNFPKALVVFSLLVLKHCLYRRSSWLFWLIWRYIIPLIPFLKTLKNRKLERNIDGWFLLL